MSDRTARRMGHGVYRWTLDCPAPRSAEGAAAGFAGATRETGERRALLGRGYESMTTEGGQPGLHDPRLPRADLPERFPATLQLLVLLPEGSLPREQVSADAHQRDRDV